MAFSTQKDFFYWSVMHINPNFRPKYNCFQLKGYDEISLDDRSWGFDETKLSYYLQDLIRPSQIGDEFKKYVYALDQPQSPHCTDHQNYLNTMLQTLANYWIKKNCITTADLPPKLTNESYAQKSSEIDEHIENTFCKKISRLMSHTNSNKNVVNTLSEIYHEANNFFQEYHQQKKENICLKDKLLQLKDERSNALSTNVPELQYEIQKLRDEVVYLKTRNAKMHKKSASQRSYVSKLPNKLINEKVEACKELEHRISNIKMETDDDTISENTSDSPNINCASSRMEEIEMKIQNIHNMYKKKLLTIKEHNEMLQNEVCSLRARLMVAQCEAQMANRLKEDNNRLYDLLNQIAANVE